MHFESFSHVSNLITMTVWCSLRYHLLHPDYLYYRIRELQKNFKLRVVLCHVDVVSSWLKSFLSDEIWLCIGAFVSVRNLYNCISWVAFSHFDLYYYIKRGWFSNVLRLHQILISNFAHAISYFFIKKYACTRFKLSLLSNPD